MGPWLNPGSKAEPPTRVFAVCLGILQRPADVSVHKVDQHVDHAWFVLLHPHLVHELLHLSC